MKKKKKPRQIICQRNSRLDELDILIPGRPKCRRRCVSVFYHCWYTPMLCLIRFSLTLLSSHIMKGIQSVSLKCRCLSSLLTVQFLTAICLDEELNQFSSAVWCRKKNVYMLQAHSKIQRNLFSLVCWEFTFLTLTKNKIEVIMILLISKWWRWILQKLEKKACQN